jgi:hypothetical protein
LSPSSNRGSGPDSKAAQLDWCTEVVGMNAHGLEDLHPARAAFRSIYFVALSRRQDLGVPIKEGVRGLLHIQWRELHDKGVRPEDIDLLRTTTIVDETKGAKCLPLCWRAERVDREWTSVPRRKPMPFSGL